MPNWLRFVIAVVAVGVLCSFMPQHAAGARQAPPGDFPERANLERYCTACHNARRRVAGLALDGMGGDQMAAQAEAWEKAIRKLRIGSMPPPGRPRPSAAEYESLIAAIEAALDRSAVDAPRSGRPTIHRLNRAEYANVVRDLLALEINAAELVPPDESGYGFDNIADVLSLPSTLLERYMLAAWKISRLAVGDPTLPSEVGIYRFGFPLLQDERMGNDQPFGSRGGAAIRHHFPLDGEYEVRIRMHRAYSGSNAIRGLANREQLDLRLDGERIQTFAIGGGCRDSPEDPRCIRPPATPGTAKPSEYERTADHGLQARFSAKAGLRVLGVAFRKRLRSAPETAGALHPPVGHNRYSYATNVDMSVERVEIAGPLTTTGSGNTPSRLRIFVCRPTGPADEEPCARQIISTLARRAYRRPITPQDVDRLLPFYREGHAHGGFETGIQLFLERLLVSPEFLFRIERQPEGLQAGTLYRINDVELASRLSFFLWSSIPDEELLELAARESLQYPDVLEQQVRRMLADERAAALVQNFFGQWLYLRNMQNVTPHPDAFPEFDDNLRQAFQRETELFLASQLRSDRSVLELLTADYTFLNERLAKHYGIPHVYGTRFRRVPLTGGTRAGILGHGSVLTVSSYATRTSPVLRGKYLLENFLGSPPPPPPPDAPALTEDETAAQPTSVRERLEQHRRNPACAVCHAQIDPLGFALENFNGIGKWRTTEGETVVDASGTLPDGTKFHGPKEFRSAFLQPRYREAFLTTVTEKLLTYALGRGVEPFDMPAVREILRQAAPSDFRWSSVILGITNSLPFQKAEARPRAEAAEVARK